MSYGSVLARNGNEQQPRYRNYRTQVSEPVAVAGVERGYVGQGIGGIEGGPDLAREWWTTTLP